MYEFRYLLDRFWVTRADHKGLYFSVKRALPNYRRLINEQLGWNLIVNESVIKLEKVPPEAMAWMGIQEFQEKLDYCLLCGMLLFLSDLDDGEQFLLSSLTEALEAILAEVQPVDWTRFPHRKALVRVLQYAQRTGMLLAYDGVSEGFGNDQTQEVLYENTGLSRHFPVHFGRDIMKCRSIEDFEAFSWEGEEAERGRQRIQRVYRQLTLAPALYWSEQNHSDYDYVKNQRSWLNRYLGEALGGELQIHKNGAFFVLDEENSLELDDVLFRGYYNPQGGENYAISCYVICESGQVSTYDNEHTVYEMIDLNGTEAILGTSTNVDGTVSYYLIWDKNGIHCSINGNMDLEQFLLVAESIY